MSTTPPVRQRLNAVVGIPDDRAAKVTVDLNTNMLRVSTDGITNISNFLPAHLFAVKLINLDPEVSVPVQFEPGPILNQIADPDRCRLTLEQLEAILLRNARACFNHPGAIKTTDRLSIAQKLAGIEGLHVPQTLRFDMKDSVAAVGEEIAAAGMQYPVLARVAGDHGGVSLIKIDSADELAALSKLNAFGKAIYLTAFHDFVSPDGRYRKFRVVVVGDQIFLRHMFIGETWLLHYRKRGKNTEQEESKMLESFADTLAPRIAPIVAEVTRRLDLDYYGIDCHISESGEITLFEANACMNILVNPAPLPNIWEKPNARIHEALFSLLRRPRAWRHPPRVAATAAG